MATVIAPIGIFDLEDVVAVMNQSSSGHVFEFRLTAMEFLGLSNFWNFSYEHSFLVRVDGEAAGIVLSSIDRADLEAWSFYWGVVPEFRGGLLSLRLVTTYLNRLAEQGYRRTFADISEGSPAGIYERLGFQNNGEHMEIEWAPSAPFGKAEAPNVRQLSANEALSVLTDLPPSGAHWAQKPAVLRTMSSHLTFFAVGDNRIELIAACSPRSKGTLVLDVRFLPGRENLVPSLARAITSMNMPGPIRFSFVPPDSDLYGALSQGGFTPRQQFHSLVLDLDAWRDTRLSKRV